MEATARQTEAVVGVNWGGGVYVNYAFVLAWACETVYWRWDSAGYAARPRALVWGLRAFYFVIILNAAVVFAAAPRRAAGALLALWLLAIWRPERRAGTGSGV
jgi:hypothetical protein